MTRLVDRRHLIGGMASTCTCLAAPISARPVHWRMPNSRLVSAQSDVDVDDDQDVRRSLNGRSLGIGPCGANGARAVALPATSHTTGNAQFDQLVAAETQVLTRVFQVGADFAFLVDDDEPNAYAFRPGALGVNGTVLMGLTLMNLSMESYPTGWGAVIAGILGHEWGHILMYSSGLQVPRYIMETHADFLAGWYMGCKNVYFRMPIALDALAHNMFRMGVSDGFFNPETYGSPRQRSLAVMEGFRAAHAGAASNANANLAGVFNYGLQVVQALVGQE